MRDNLKDYITVREAAKRMGRSAEQIRRYLRDGKLVGQRIGGQWFIREEAVLYKVRGQEETDFTMYYNSDTTNYRYEIFERINCRREEIRKRWEKLGVAVNVVDLLEEIREERE